RAAVGFEDWLELRHQFVPLAQRQRREAFRSLEDHREVRVKEAPIRPGSGDEHALGVAGARRGFGTPKRAGFTPKVSDRELFGDAIEVDGDQRVADVEKDGVDVGVGTNLHAPLAYTGNRRA